MQDLAAPLNMRNEAAPSGECLEAMGALGHPFYHVCTQIGNIHARWSDFVHLGTMSSQRAEIIASKITKLACKQNSIRGLRRGLDVTGIEMAYQLLLPDQVTNSHHRSPVDLAGDIFDG